MTLRRDEPASDVREIDRFEGGVGWIAHPDEAMQRASHALALDGGGSAGDADVWVFDPVDAADLDDLLEELGEVAGVVVGLDRHTRDAATVATRHDVPVYLPDWFSGVADDLDAPVRRFGAELADTGLEVRAVATNRFWQEAVFYDPDRGTLLVPEAIGTADFFLAGDERLGVHPMLRALPPRDTLGGFEPERVLVGHGPGVLEDATAALRVALRGSRRRAPHLYAKNVRAFLPV